MADKLLDRTATEINADLALARASVQPGDAVSTLVETTSAKILTGAERTKLAGVADGATANAADADLRDRSTHTGTQASTTVTVSATDRLLGRDTTGAGAAEEITVGGGLQFDGTGGLRTTAFTGEVTKAAGGTTLTIAANAVTNAKMATMVTGTVKANLSGSTATPSDATLEQLVTALGLGGAALLDVGTTEGTVCAGDDSRLSDAASAVQPGDDAAALGSGSAAAGLVLTSDGAGGAAWEVAGGSGMTAQEIADAIDADSVAETTLKSALGLAGAAYLDVGTTTGKVCAGDDSRLSDSRAPTAHATGSHSDWPAAVSMTEVGYLDGVTSAIQTQLAGKSATTHDHASTYQPLDAELTAIAGLTSAANRVPYFTGAGSAALATLTDAGRALIDDADASAQRATLGLGGAATLAVGTTAGTVCAGNDARLSDARTPTSHTQASTTISDSTAAGRALLTAEDAAAQRAALALVIGTDVQAQSANLEAVAGLTSAANTLPYFTDAGAAALTSLPAAARTLLAASSAAAERAIIEAAAPSTVAVSTGTTLSSATHQGKLLVCSTTLALTVGTSNVFTNWTSCDIYAAGGAVTVSASGTTIRVVAGKSFVIPQYGRATLMKTATTNEWVLTGELGTA